MLSMIKFFVGVLTIIAFMVIGHIDPIEQPIENIKERVTALGERAIDYLDHNL